MLKIFLLSLYVLLFPPAHTRDYSIRDLGDAGTTEYDLRELNEHGFDIEAIPSAEYWGGTEARRVSNRNTVPILYFNFVCNYPKVLIYNCYK